MADDIRLICWATPDRLAIGILVKNPSSQPRGETEELVQLDTGYSGELLVPYDLFETLNLRHWRLPQPAQATTVTGQVIHLLEAHAGVIIPKTGEEYRVVVQTFAGNTRFLIGRAFLRRFKVLLDGPSGRTCLMTPE
ncbi:MAG: hypothetical protein HY327_05480 [Chloroflexi bacterium]|nr:hypothetical protein [Chloroflexota bacterium]